MIYKNKSTFTLVVGTSYCKSLHIRWAIHWEGVSPVNELTGQNPKSSPDMQGTSTQWWVIQQGTRGNATLRPQSPCLKVEEIIC